MTEEEKVEHPIAEALNAFLHAVRDIEAAVKIFMPIGYKIINDRFKETISKLEKLVDDAENEDKQIRTTTQAELDREFTRLERLRNTKLPHHLEKSLFIGLFSAYDAFIGELLKAIIKKRPSLLKKIGKTISLSDVIAASNIDHLKDHVLDQYVEDFRRDNYSKQFKAMEGFFDVQLTKFDSYPSFIEASQRRHLFTHCNCLVSQQYLKNCSEVDYQHSEAVNKGDCLELGPKYFYNVCDVLFEVGLKLAHTLWRKQFPDEIYEADKELSDAIFGLLKNERWNRAMTAGEFAFAQKKFSDRERQKIIIANYCISLKFGGREEESQRILRTEDWSDSKPDFRLAKAVLLDDFGTATDLMKVIGKSGELVSVESYHTWPLFRAFRSDDSFRKTYEEIYGYSFVGKVKKELERTQEHEQAPREPEAEPGA